MTEPASEATGRTRVEGAPLTPQPAVPRRVQALLALLAVAVVTLGAIVLAQPAGASAPGAAPGPHPDVVAPTGHTTDVMVSVDGMSYSPSVIEVPAGDRLVITFDNTGDQRHDLVLANGAETPAIAPGEQAALDAGVISQSMDGWCSLPGHRAMGMELTIVAVGGADAARAGGRHVPDHAGQRGQHGPLDRLPRRRALARRADAHHRARRIAGL